MADLDDFGPKNGTGREKSKGAGGTCRPGSLTTFAKLRAEASRVYRDARQGKLSPQDAARLVYVLTMISKLIEAAGQEPKEDKSTAARLLEIMEAGAMEAQEDGAEPAEANREDRTDEIASQELQADFGEQHGAAPGGRRFYIPGVKKNPMDELSG